ncbi:MAG TPA: glycoside hydrolase family 20 zincin-like fold domain-containing protein, partial [Gemmatimonadales bacterium]
MRRSPVGLLVLSCLAAPLAAQQPATLDLMPVPRALTLGEGRLRLDSSFTVAFAPEGDARLARAVARAMERLARRTALTLSTVPVSDSNGGLVIAALAPGEPVQTETEDESYTLHITPERATLGAPTVVGVLRGLETLLQLVTVDSVGFYFPAVHIEDAPRFPWRGLLVDAGRHFEPIEVIERTL